ncbi:MAG TPA: RDD family protein [Patescibacteria group bacterium]|nr:RDD family protein [Patescibacteria group bacterium]
MPDESEQPDARNVENDPGESEPAASIASMPEPDSRSGAAGNNPENMASSTGLSGDSDVRSNLTWFSTQRQQPTADEAIPGVANRPTRSATFTRVTLGSALLTLDTISDRLEQAREIDQEAVPTPRSAENVLVPVSEWEEQFGETPDLTARYLALGMMIDVRTKASRGVKLARSIGDLAANGINIVIGPLGRSRAVSPFRRKFDTSVERGESQVNHWMALGRVEDARSRQVAEVAVGQIADEAMDDIVESERIQLFIQEIVSAQSMGIIDEAIEEVRERTLSTDIFLERPFRRVLRRPKRDKVPRPDYDPEVIRPVRRGNRPLQEHSLLGYYAGFMSRLFAFALDIAFLAAFMAISSWLLSTVIGLLGLGGPFNSFREATTPADISGTIFVTLYGVTVVVGYFVLFWVLTGQTLGMMILGLRVVAHDGDPLTLIQAILRFFGFMISASFLFIGFAWILIDDRREGWPDKIARSYVVYAWDANPDESFLFDYVSSNY